MKINKFKKIIAGILIPAITLFLFSCQTYKSVYKNVKTKLDQKIYSILLYETSSKRINTVLNYPENKKAVTYRNMLKQIAESKNMSPSEYERLKRKRIRQANMKFGDYNKGMFTDRGRIYIKHGEPETEKTINTKKYGSVLVWEYPGIGEIFRFSMSRFASEYKLLLTDDIN